MGRSGVGPDLVQHRVADLHGVFRLRAGEALRAVLEEEVALILLAQLFDEPGAVHGDSLDLLPGLVEHLPPLGLAGGVVEVDDGPGGALHRLKGPADDVVPALGQHLDGHVLRDALLVDELAEEFVLRLRRRREAHLDLLEADLHQHVVELQLLLQAHGHHQTLVAVPQVHAAPGGGGLDVVLPRPLVHVPRLHRRGIVADLIFRRVHHVKVLLLGLRLWKEGNKKSHLSKDHQSLRDGSKNAVPAVPLSLPAEPATQYDRPPRGGRIASA